VSEESLKQHIALLGLAIDGAREHINMYQRMTHLVFEKSERKLLVVSCQHPDCHERFMRKIGDGGRDQASGFCEVHAAIAKKLFARSGLHITKFGNLPPKAAKKALSIDGWHDVFSVKTNKLGCGCYTSIIDWEKDCGAFEDRRTSRVDDFAPECQKH